MDRGAGGETTVDMVTAGTLLDAGWDFVDETENGTDDTWWILEGQDYPRLWWELGDGTSPYVKYQKSNSKITKQNIKY